MTNFNLSSLVRMALITPKRCLQCGKNCKKGLEVWATPSYYSGTKRTYSVFCDSDCYRDFDNNLIKDKSNEPQGEYIW